MKKVLFMLIALFQLFDASADPTDTLIMTKVTPSDVCRGEDLTVSFKFKFHSASNATSQYSFYYKNSIGQIWPGRIIQYAEIFGLPKTLQGTDTIYTFVLSVAPSVPFSHYLFLVSPDNNYPGKNVDVIDCGITGIEEYELNGVIPVYYDLRGNKIDKRCNELIIEQAGLNRRKIYIQK